jgi:hypothetical protein
MWDSRGRRTESSVVPITVTGIVYYIVLHKQVSRYQNRDCPLTSDVMSLHSASHPLANFLYQHWITT